MLTRKMNLTERIIFGVRHIRDEVQIMSTVQEIEKAITQLPKNDFGVLSEWLEEFEEKMWDNQFEEDVQSGRLEKLANEAIADFRAGRCREL